VRKLPVLRPVYQDNAQDDDPEDVNAMHEENGGGDKPEFVFPWTGE
jgi:hypothetical protein